MPLDGSAGAPVYRYFTTDLLTQDVLAEIPFKGVNFERAIRTAGTFQGTIPAIQTTNGLDLYESTMPGRCGLYVMRDDTCVWGGIVWSRSYKADDYSLSVTAVEFTKYLQHRAIWKTWTHDFSASATISGGVATVTLKNAMSYLEGFEAGSSVRIFFGQLNPVNTVKASGYYTIKASPAPTTTSFAVDVPLLAGVSVTDPDLTVYVRADTYDYTRTLVEAVLSDLQATSFPNDEIEPGQQFDVDIASYSKTGTTATVTTATPHGVIPGQTVEVSGIAELDGSYSVTSTPTLQSVTFAKAGAAVPTTTANERVVAIATKALALTYVTMTTSVPHGLLPGQVVAIAGAGGVTAASPGNTTTQAAFDGRYIVDSTPTATSFKYVIDTIPELALVATPATGATVAVKPRLIYDSYGPFLSNTDIGIEFSTQAYSGSQVANTNFRGFEVRMLGEELAKYSNQINGFEYRIDCNYDATTKTFGRTLVLRPINILSTLTAEELASDDPIRLISDEIIFEWPGNITSVSMDETAEGAATRMWVKGNIGDLGGDVSQPYSAASAYDLLNAGWPLLEEVESLNDTGDEETLAAYAQTFLDESRPPLSNIKIEVNGSVTPIVGSYAPGDWCTIIIDDDFILMRLASDLEPRDTVLVRKIEKIKVTVPDGSSFPEKVDLDLAVEGAVDRVGD